MTDKAKFQGGMVFGYSGKKTYCQYCEEEIPKRTPRCAFKYVYKTGDNSYYNTIYSHPQCFADNMMQWFEEHDPPEPKPRGKSATRQGLGLSNDQRLVREAQMKRIYRVLDNQAGLLAQMRDTDNPMTKRRHLRKYDQLDRKRREIQELIEQTGVTPAQYRKKLMVMREELDSILRG